MTGKIKRRSLRCGGRPKADFGSIFTTFIAPALGVAGSVADSAISKAQVSKSNTKPAIKETNTEVTNNNTSVENLPTTQAPTKEPISGLVTSNTVIPPDPTKTPTMRLGGRKKCWIGAAIMGATSIAGSLFGAAAQKREMRRQKSIKDWQDTTQEAANMSAALNNSQDYQEDYLRQFRTAARLGKTLGAKGIYITDGGDATKIDNNTYLLRGGSHEDVNETGQTGIGINVGGNEVEAEGGEVAQKKNGALRIFSAQPILGNGMSPAQAVMKGASKDKVFTAQQQFKKRNGLKDDGSKAQIGGYYGANYPSPLSLLSVIYNKTLGRFDNKNPFLQTGVAPTPSRGLNLKQVRNGLVNKNMLRTNRVYRITNMREVKDAKAVGQYREIPDGVTLPSRKVTTRHGLTFDFGKAYGNSHGGKAASMGKPWTGTTSGGYGESRYVISTPSRHTIWRVGHHGNYSKPLPADAIKKGSGIWKKFDAEGNTGISTKRMVVYKELGNGRYLRLSKSKYRLGGDLTSKDRGSSKHPYPSVSSKDFAGGGRSYPIPTKADAVDALRLAGLHGRSDVKAKVYSRYPELRKKAEYGVNIDPYRNYSTTYKNKTSRGNKLSIRNGIVFLNNKRAPKGYKWFDKGNSTTYLVGNDGRFSIHQIHGKKPLERIDFNDDTYAQEANSRLELSNASPNLPLYKADAQVWKDVLAKDKLERKHIIPNRLPNVRTIKLNTKEIQTNNKGKKFSNFKGVEIPINLIDSVYKWTKEANQPLVNGFGLLGETNAGNTAPMSEDPNTKGYSNKVVRNNSGRYVSYIRPTELVNHHQFWLGPTSNLINHLIRNGKVKDNIFESGSNAINYLPTDANYIEGDKKTYDEVNNALRYIKKDTGNPNPFINALDYLKTGKYHIDKNYNNKVKERGRDFMTDKNVINRINYLRKRHTLGGRPKALGGTYVPFNKRYTSIYDAPDYDDYNGGNVLGNKEVTVTAKRIKPTFLKPNNDAMNIINHPANETPYIPQKHNRSRTIFSGGDYLGLGIDTLAALSTGLVNYNTAGKYVLPDRAPIIQASKLPTTYNVAPEIEEVKRYRDRLTGETYRNTSSSVAALNRAGTINLDALSNLSKLWATKENEENKMLTQDALNQQTVATQNVQNELARQSEIARIENEANQAKGDALNVGLSGLSQAWTNFWTAGRTAYEDDQSRRAMIASSKEATPTRLMETNFDLSPDVIASLYKTSKDDRTKRFYLSRLSPKQRQRYGIN